MSSATNKATSGLNLHVIEHPTLHALFSSLLYGWTLSLCAFRNKSSPVSSTKVGTESQLAVTVLGGSISLATRGTMGVASDRGKRFVLRQRTVPVDKRR
jgi:hypothetical protein